MGTAFYALTAISEKKPQMLLPHDDVMIEKILSNNTIACQGIGILVEVSMAYPVSAISNNKALPSRGNFQMWLLFEGGCFSQVHL